MHYTKANVPRFLNAFVTKLLKALTLLQDSYIESEQNVLQLSLN